MQGDRQAAAEAVRVRLAELDWNPIDLSRRAGLDPESVNAFLRGKTSPRLQTRARIERALGWAPGSLEGAATGQRPAAAPDDDVEQLMEAVFALRQATTATAKLRVLHELAGRVLADTDS